MKAAVLLSELGRYSLGITVTELAQAVRMTRPTAFRLLLTLEQTGFVDRVDNRYMLGWQMARLGRIADPHSGAVARIQPVMDQYASVLNETLTFALPKGELDFDLIAEAWGSRMVTVSQNYIGGSWALHASATGKIILAELNDDRIRAALPDTLTGYTANTITSHELLLREIRQVRKQGYALLDNELEEGLFVIGCAARDAAGGLVGILTINGPTERLKSARLHDIVETGMQAADEIAKALL